MTYKLEFLPSARKEWDKLGHTLREQFKKKLAERLEVPRIPSDALHGMPDCYKIKLKSSDRLVYEVIDERVIVSVVAVGKRERSQVYPRAKKR
jgi:mRNA interferase RelE/StbE